MKIAFLALSVLVTLNVSVASDLSKVDIVSLAEKTMTKLNETRYIIKENGYCDEYEGEIECVWEIEDTGRTNDTMHGIFIEKNGELILINAYEEYGC